MSSGQGKVREIPDLAKVREKSGNFVEGQGKNEYWEKSGKSQGICIYCNLSSKKIIKNHKTVCLSRVFSSVGCHCAQSCESLKHQILYFDNLPH